MIAIPAIDLKDGKVVRLVQGRREEATVYSHDPLETARNWAKQGAIRIHIIDLDGAFSGELKNLAITRQIIAETRAAVQFGGGLRNREDFEAILSVGAKWAILGTKACEDANFVQQLAAEFGEQLIVSVDVKFKKVAARGWTDVTQIDDVDFIKKMQDIGVRSFIYTDISRDGTLAGVKIEDIQRVLEQTKASILYSGGISTLEDVKNLRTLKRLGLTGIIIGKALYENKIPLMRVIKMLEEGT